MKFSSPRQLIMAGGFLGGLGLIINIFAKNIYFFIFSQSLLVGKTSTIVLAFRHIKVCFVIFKMQMCT